LIPTIAVLAAIGASPSAQATPTLVAGDQVSLVAIEGKRSVKAPA